MVVSLFIEFIAKVVLSLCITSLNAIVLIAFIRERELRNRETNVYLASLAVSDLVVGLVVMPWYIATDYMLAVLNEPPPITACRPLVTIQAGLTIVTQLHLIAISIDRYVKIQYDFYYLVRTNTRRAYVRVIIIWLISWPIASVCFWGSKSLNACNILLFDADVDLLIALIASAVIILPAASTICLNCIVYYVIKQKRRKLAIRANVKIYTVRNDQVIVHTIEETLLGAKSLSDHIAQVVKQHKTILMILAINCAYLMTWPFLLVIWMFVQYHERQQMMNPVVLHLQNLLPWVGIVNSAINPIILMIMHVKFRRAVVKHFLELISTPHEVHTDTTHTLSSNRT